jgi:hypothetical protein
MSVLEFANNIIEDLPKNKFEKATNYLEIINLSCEIIELASKKNKNATSEEKRECAVIIAKKLTQKITLLNIINKDVEKDILNFIDSHSNIYEEIDTMVNILNNTTGCCKKVKNKFKTRYL